MKNKKILFRIGQEDQHRMRFGEVAELYRGCYIRGKELGYEDGNIYFEWPMKVAYNDQYMYKIYYQCPSETILPIKFIHRFKVNLKDYDKIMDLTKPNIFYDGSVPIYIGSPEQKDLQKKTYLGHWNYFNKYYIETGKRPIFNISKNKLDNPYILFHVRIAGWSEYRNPDLKIYRNIIKLLKDKYSDKYEFWKCGEKCRGLDKMFDYISPFYENLNDFLKLINNTTLFICTDSGPNAFGYGMGIPIIEIEVSKVTRKGKPGFLSKEYWEENGQYGETTMSWVNEEKFRTFFKGDSMDYNKFIKYTDRWLNG